jgi:N6-L-threonylcarbamoyladenine synthase
MASFQHAVIMTLLDRAKRAAAYLHPNSILLTGGVACNRGLRCTFSEHFAVEGLPVLFPRPELTTDNAAMIAAAAVPKIERREFARHDLNASAALPITSQRVHIPSPLLNN